MMEERTKIDGIFLLLVIALTVFGLFMLTSVSGPIAYSRFGDSYYFIKNQLFSGFLPGIIGFTFGALVPYRLWRKYAFPMLLLSIGLLTMVFIPGLGTDFGTFAKSWVQIGGQSFQPVELVKLTFLFYLAAWLEKSGEEVKDLQSGLLPFLIVLGIIGLLIFLQPDLGSLMIIAAMSVTVYFVAGGPVKHLLGLGAVAGFFFFLAVKMSPYRMDRFMTFLHPELDPQGIGYQINQAMLAIGSGGFFGRGYGHSLQKFQYLPEVIGDSFFAVMAEELGFLFTLGFLALFIAFLFRGFRVAEFSSDAFGRYLATGIMAWLGIQAFVNIGAIIGLLPLTGVTLPFFSYGGSSLAVTLLACGVVLNISKTASYEKRT